MQNSEKIIFFDGVCSLCNGFIDYIVSKDSKRQFHISSLQGKTAKKHLSEDEIKNLDTVVYLKNGVKHHKAAAVIRILAELKWYYTPLMIFLLLPTCLRNLGYDLIAYNRYRLFGKMDSCRLPTEEEKLHFLP